MGSNNDSAVTIEGNDQTDSKKIDPEKNRFPCCIVWTPLPVLSWLLPCLGHIGICREDGIILDFAGPNYISVDNFAFGAPTLYVQLSKDQCFAVVGFPAQAPGPGGETAENGGGEGKETMSWDDALGKSTLEYQNLNYNMFTRNCHSFVANCLNRLKFQAGNWNVANLAVLVLTKGQYLGSQAILRTYGPFVLLFCLGVILAGDFFLNLLTLFILFVIIWFVLGSYCSKKWIYV